MPRPRRQTTSFLRGTHIAKSTKTVATGKKPNILVIWGDDIGITNLSCYSHGVMGYQTPNIDRIAKEGMMFTDSYGEQSCTAGRSSFITGQSVYFPGQARHRREHVRPVLDRQRAAPQHVARCGDAPFRSEKNTNWEGAFRVPLLVRWPGKIKAGSISNEIVQHHDWMPTFLAMAGAPDVIEQLKKGYKAIGRTYKNHIDGFNLLPYLTGQEKKSPRNFFFYFSDDGDVLAVRMDNFKVTFMEQRTKGTLAVWQDPFVPLRAPNIYNLRTDPFEYATVTSNTYYDWMFHHAYLCYAAQAVTGKFLETFKNFPPVQKPNTFTIDQAMEKMSESAASH